MTCQRPGCSNEVGLRVDTMSPKRFCDDPECRRLRHLVCVHLYQAREKGDLPPFVRRGKRKRRRAGNPEARERLKGMLGTRQEVRSWKRRKRIRKN